MDKSVDFYLNKNEVKFNFYNLNINKIYLLNVTKKVNSLLLYYLIEL